MVFCYDPLRRREGIPGSALYMSVGRWVGRSVCNNFDYKLRLNLNLLRQFGKSLPLSRSITREHLNLPSSNMVHASILDSRGTLLILGSVGQGHQGKICQNRFRSITWESIDLPSSNFHTSILGSKKYILILRSLDQRSRSPVSNVSIPFPFNNSRTPWPILLKLHLSTHPPWVAEEPYWFWSHWIKKSPGSNVPKPFKLQIRKWISSSYICATNFEPTSQLYKTYATQFNSLGHIKFTNILFLMLTD